MTEDPYQILNVPRNATPSQIKSAYRKLALKYHPDKQSASKSASEKQANSECFTSIGNAYEILGDADRRRAYDQFGTTTTMDHDEWRGSAQQQQQQGGRGDPFGGGFGGFGGGFGRDPFDHPFFSGGVGGRNVGGFMDPFETFRRAFGDDFYGHPNGGNGRNEYNEGHGGGDPFMSGFGFPGHAMNNMNSMFENMQQQMGGGGGGNGQSQSYSTSYSSSSFGSGGNHGGGTRQSVTTKTQIINGKQQTVTEKTTVYPDGRVETTTETTGDEDFPGSLEYGGSQRNHGGRLMNGDHGNDLQRRTSRSSRY